MRGEPVSAPPRSTAIGALAHYVSHAESRNYQPTNITFGIIAPLQPSAGRRVPKKKVERNLALSARALADLDEWMQLTNPPIHQFTNSPIHQLNEVSPS